MKRIFATILTAILLVMLVGCECKHEWVDADCSNPKTCAKCGETEGEKLGHDWIDENCTAPKTCSRCAKTKGEALGHDWIDATCDTAKTCARCGEIEGEALGHNWLDATTEDPRTCSLCGLTEGYPLSPNERFDTALCEPLFGTWCTDYAIPGEEFGDGFEAYLPELSTKMFLSFAANGKCTLELKITGMDDLRSAMNLYTIDLMYAQFELMGLDKAAADEAFMQTYEMTIESYVALAMEDVDMSTIVQDTSDTYVYYIIGDQLYLASTWDEDAEPSAFRIDADILSIDMSEDGSEFTDFTRVTE